MARTKYSDLTPEQKEKRDAAHEKYMKSFVEIKVRMTPERRSQIQEYVKNHPAYESVTQFINEAIDAKMGMPSGED